jgi:hypothetical protein
MDKFRAKFRAQVIALRDADMPTLRRLLATHGMLAANIGPLGRVVTVAEIISTVWGDHARYRAVALAAPMKIEQLAPLLTWHIAKNLQELVDMRDGAASPWVALRAGLECGAIPIKDRAREQPGPGRASHATTIVPDRPIDGLLFDPKLAIAWLKESRIWEHWVPEAFRATPEDTVEPTAPAAAVVPKQHPPETAQPESNAPDNRCGTDDQIAAAVLAYRAGARSRPNQEACVNEVLGKYPDATRKRVRHFYNRGAMGARGRRSKLIPP